VSGEHVVAAGSDALDGHPRPLPDQVRVVQPRHPVPVRLNNTEQVNYYANHLAAP